MRAHPLVLSPVALLILACGGSKPKTERTAPDPHITSFTAEPGTIPLGGTARLHAVFQDGVGTIEPNPGNATEPWVFDVKPEKNQTYKLTVKNTLLKEAIESATVTVVPPRCHHYSALFRWAQSDRLHRQGLRTDSGSRIHV